MLTKYGNAVKTHWIIGILVKQCSEHLRVATLHSKIDNSSTRMSKGCIIMPCNIE